MKIPPSLILFVALSGFLPPKGLATVLPRKFGPVQLLMSSTTFVAQVGPAPSDEADGLVVGEDISGFEIRKPNEFPNWYIQFKRFFETSIACDFLDGKLYRICFGVGSNDLPTKDLVKAMSDVYGNPKVPLKDVYGEAYPEVVWQDERTRISIVYEQVGTDLSGNILNPGNVTRVDIYDRRLKKEREGRSVVPH